MTFQNVSLFNLIKQGIGKETIMKILSGFSCPLNPSVEYFMKNKAYDFERVGLARTYFITYDISDVESKLIAVYVLGMSNVEINKNFNSAEKRKMFGTTYPLGKNVKTLLIGQLAKNYADGNDKLISGNMIMQFVFSKIKMIHEMFPSVVTHIDCIDNPHLRKFYEDNGFQLFLTKDDRLVYLFPTNKIYDEVSVLND